MSKWTPGPWMQIAPGRIVTTDADPIATCAKCNGALIAAAPEMAEALKALLRVLDTNVDFDAVSDGEYNEIGAAIAILARIKGAE